MNSNEVFLEVTEAPEGGTLTAIVTEAEKAITPPWRAVKGTLFG